MEQSYALLEAAISCGSPTRGTELAYDALVQAGLPGLLGGAKGDREVRFILDGDFSAAGSLPGDAVPQRLEVLHRYAVRLFRGAVTPQAHQAMGPLED